MTETYRGWTRGTDLRPHYTREVVAGPLTFLIDVWQADENGREWAYSFQARNAENQPLPTAEKAMAAAVSLLAGYLRQAARLLKERVEPDV
jgi:hypothetical protein